MMYVCIYLFSELKKAYIFQPFIQLKEITSYLRHSNIFMLPKFQIEINKPEPEM